jgi:hypothetical protein
LTNDFPDLRQSRIGRDLSESPVHPLAIHFQHSRAVRPPLSEVGDPGEHPVAVFPDRGSIQLYNGLIISRLAEKMPLNRVGQSLQAADFLLGIGPVRQDVKLDRGRLMS